MPSSALGAMGYRLAREDGRDEHGGGEWNRRRLGRTRGAVRRRARRAYRVSPAPLSAPARVAGSGVSTPLPAVEAALENDPIARAAVDHQVRIRAVEDAIPVALLAIVAALR